MSLVPRERQILDLLCQGKPDKRIAEVCEIKYSTIRVYISALYKRIGVPNRSAAAIWWNEVSKLLAANGVGAVSAPVLEPSVDRALPRAVVPPKRPKIMAPGFEMAADISFGSHALKHGLLSALGSMSIYIGIGPRWAESHGRVCIKDSIGTRVTTLQWLYEQFLAGTHDEAIAGWEAMLADDRSAQGNAILECMHALLGHRGRAPLALDLSADVALVENARKWLWESDAQAKAKLISLALSLPWRHPGRHTVLITLFHGGKQREELDIATAAAEAILLEAQTARDFIRQVAGFDIVGRSHPLCVEKKYGPVQARQESAQSDKCDDRR